MTGLEVIVIPLVALAIPITLLLGALVFDAVYLSWIAYRWYQRAHPHRLHLPR